MVIFGKDIEKHGKHKGTENEDKTIHNLRFPDLEGVLGYFPGSAFSTIFRKSAGNMAYSMGIF